MRKEVVLAIVFGFFLGLLIVGGIWWTNKNTLNLVPESENLSQPQADSQENTPSPAVDQSGTDQVIFLDIDSPEEGEIVDQDEIRVVGKTVPGAVVVLIYPEGETIAVANDQGDFEATALLVGGANEIKITVYDQQGNQTETLLTVVYSTAKL